VGTRERFAFGLMLFTGQRRTDVFRMTWADINGDEIRVTRLNTRHGKAITLAGFSDLMHTAIKSAGLPAECRAHGLRKGAGRRLAEAGRTAKEVQGGVEVGVLTTAANRLQFMRHS
jgi:enterobacteria phage integrase